MRPQPEQPLPPGLDPNVNPPTVSMGTIPGPAANSASAPSAGNPSVANTAPKANPWPSRGGEAPPFRAKPSDVRDQVADLPPPPQQNGLASAKPGLPATPSAVPPPPTDLPPPPDAQSEPKYPAGVKDPFASQNQPGGGNEAAPSPSTAATQVSLLGAPHDEHPRTSSIKTILQQVDLKIHENKLADALLLLSPLQDNPDVPEYQARQITEDLDCMAAKVIYSREHLLERPYGVQPGDTLDSIAEHFKVPALLLARINGIDAHSLRPGKELKVLKGPFSAARQHRAGGDNNDAGGPLRGPLPHGAEQRLAARHGAL